MANRPVFTVGTTAPFVSEVGTEFTFHPGFSIQQKQRSIASLHESFMEDDPGLRILEVSSKSPLHLGVRLSAFNLLIHHPGRENYSVESAFQASKVFENGGPFDDLLDKTSREAKKDPRLKESGQLVGFKFFSRQFPLEPKTFFYDWLYAKALFQNKELFEEAVNFDAFTDIEYNPKRSINCQARAIAKVAGLWRCGLLEKALESPETFLSIGYPGMESDSVSEEKSKNEPVQERLF
ncbi:hypothetical protein J7S19_08665 [Corynebacterium pyruviciproducens]|uniref:DarT1-associated NADAR antitoxin family protein n=1 Tax=Corynebacterium pyruviciproducens TaxID=598660 RepID=UPI002457586D|nr:hypothetical protein [Corynebacterium pyruviciproducens]MDH4658674.1 hypothetical protein [Corynebacterium pyruviciproducens]